MSFMNNKEPSREEVIKALKKKYSWWNQTGIQAGVIFLFLGLVLLAQGNPIGFAGMVIMAGMGYLHALSKRNALIITDMFLGMKVMVDDHEQFCQLMLQAIENSKVESERKD